jgi:ATP-dependent protease HslVU (ClpYQ) peptidase subunit
MTTIVGIRSEKHREVWIGSDTRLTSHSTYLGKLSKTVVTNVGSEDETCLAIAGPSTAILAVQDVLADAKFEWDSTLSVYRSMLSIHCLLRDHHGLNVTYGEDSPFEPSNFEAVIGNTHGMWMMLSSREIIPVTNLCAIGSGREFALGAAEAQGLLDPEATIKRALSIASQYDKDTGKEAEFWTNAK